MRYTLLTILLLLSLTVLAKDKPGGIKPIAVDKMLDLHPSNYAAFLPGFKPDMAVFVFRQPKYFEQQKDSSAGLFEVKGSYISSYSKGKGDFISNPALNKQLVQKLIGIQDLAFFRLYYKNAAGEIYKYQDLTFKGKNSVKQY